MLSPIGRISLTITALAALQMGSQNAPQVQSDEELQGPVCLLACSAGLAACCALVEGGCYFCITNYNNCVNACNGLTGGA